MPEEIVDERPRNGPFRVGDRVRRIIESAESFGFVIPVGAIGTVVRASTGSGYDDTARVAFDGYLTRNSDRSYGSYNRLLELVVDQTAITPADDGEIRVGDRVRRIRTNFASGISKGMLGTVANLPRVPGGVFYRVSWDGDDRPVRSAMRQFFERVASDTSASTPILSASEVVDRPPGEFRAGDRVRVTRVWEGGPSVGFEGVVLGINRCNSESYLVEFDQTFRGGHSGYGQCDTATCRLGCGWYLPGTHLAFAGDLVEAVPPAPKAFRIVRHTDHGTPEDVPGEAYDDGKEAGARASALTLETGIKHQPRRNALPADWRERETSRFTDGTYQPLPEGWDLTPITDHFLHLSKKRGYVAYTPGDAYGLADRQTAKRAGSYVAEFYPHLSKHDQERYAALVSCEGQLQFGSTREDFRRVYRHGPDSCMSCAFSSLPCHPAEVYAAGDLAIAWLEDDDGNITSRCVVWPERKLRTRCYGDVEKMRSVLVAAGYRGGNFYGAKLLRIDTSEGDIVCPYVDEHSSKQGDPASVNIEVMGDRLIISEDGSWEAHNTNGKLDYEGDVPSRAECDRCGDSTDVEDLSRVMDRYEIQRRWCPDCQGDHTFYCEGLGAYVDDGVDSFQGGGTFYASHNTYSRLFVDRVAAFVSDYDDRVFPTSERVEMADGSAWAVSELARHGFTCAGSGNRYSLDEPHETIGGLIYHADHLPTQAASEEETPSPEGLRAA